MANDPDLHDNGRQEIVDDLIRQIDELRQTHVALKLQRESQLEGLLLNYQSEIARLTLVLRLSQEALGSFARGESDAVAKLRALFNEDDYFKQNDDVRVAYICGSVSSAFDHWIWVGSQESRYPPLNKGS